MRIAISCPDSIGDFVLRQPMLAALAGRGHELLLVVRHFVAPIARLASPTAIVLELHANPYTNPYSLDDEASQQTLRAVAAFQPDLLVAASYQFTRQEEWVQLTLGDVDTIGFNGRLFHPGIPRPTTLRRDRTVPVGSNDSELSKYERMCHEILQERLELGRPQLSPSKLDEQRAQEIIDGFGWKQGAYAVVCAGTAESNQLRNWDPTQWPILLRRVVEQEDLKILFLGTPDEEEDTERVRAGMGVAGEQTQSLAGNPPEMGVLSALIGMSRFYLGRDTGPMHIAAAMDTPVVALFGGGHWPRFVPAAAAGAVLTVGVPCVGCEWSCHLEQSYCVKSIPEEMVWEAVATALRGEEDGLKVEVISPGADLLLNMCGEAAVTSREGRRRFEGDRYQFLEWVRERDEVAAGLQNQLHIYGQEIENARQELSGAKNELSDVRGEVGDSFVEARRILELRDLRVGQLELKLDFLRESWARKFRNRHTILQHLRQELSGLRTEMEALQANNSALANRNQELELQTTEREDLVSLLRDQLRESLLARDGAMAEMNARTARIEGRSAELEREFERVRQEKRQLSELVPELRDNLAEAERELERLRALPVVVSGVVSRVGQWLLRVRRSLTLIGRG